MRFPCCVLKSKSMWTPKIQRGNSSPRRGGIEGGGKGDCKTLLFSILPQGQDSSFPHQTAKTTRRHRPLYDFKPEDIVTFFRGHRSRHFPPPHSPSSSPKGKWIPRKLASPPPSWLNIIPSLCSPSLYSPILEGGERGDNLALAFFKVGAPQGGDPQGPFLTEFFKTSIFLGPPGPPWGWVWVSFGVVASPRGIHSIFRPQAIQKENCLH